VQLLSLYYIRDARLVSSMLPSRCRLSRAVDSVGHVHTKIYRHTYLYTGVCRTKLGTTRSSGNTRVYESIGLAGRGIAASADRSMRGLEESSHHQQASPAALHSGRRATKTTSIRSEVGREILLRAGGVSGGKLDKGGLGRSPRWRQDGSAANG
jgi:hypothetical protein